MELRVKDFMSTDYITISQNETVQAAIEKMIHSTASPKGRRIFGLMVTNDNRELVGMISMYDIFYHLRPTPVRDQNEINLLAWEKDFEKSLAEICNLRISILMTRQVVTVTEDTHIMDVIDTMIKKHIRIIAVVEGKKIIGIVYISDVFFEIYKKLLS